MRPQNYTSKKMGDIPLLHVTDFTMYELDTQGLKTLMLGGQVYRYADRYTIDKIDHTDNSKTHITNLRADFGIYKNDILTLDGNVTLVRDDGVSYVTQHAKYYKKKGLFVGNTDYILTQGKNRLTGTYVDHNNISGKIHSKNIFATYFLE
ncbi:MAG: LPS export ABC transporter periplasmic protein LptC [Epsilonproteobacteria bacterium]|nr:LPS export ABC transporter periplasmic protein LptC [Campylobacterota bacterium]